MREILFRGKRFDNSEWEYGNYNNINGKAYIFPENAPDSFDNYQVDHATVGQYTGVTDKNGTKIFEGDIIQTEFSKSIVKFGEYQHTNSQSGYRNGDLGFYAYHIDIVHRDCVRNDLLFFNEQCEVIGNIFDSNLNIDKSIHDNPELLKGGNK